MHILSHDNGQVSVMPGNGGYTVRYWLEGCFVNRLQDGYYGPLKATKPEFQYSVLDATILVATRAYDAGFKAGVAAGKAAKSEELRRVVGAS